MPNIFKRFYNSLFGIKTTTNGNGSRTFINQRPTFRGADFDLGHAELCSTVYSCVSLISNNIAKLKINVYKTTSRGREIYHDHPWQRSLAYSPDGRVSTGKWLNHYATSLCLEGGAFYYRSEYDPDKMIPQKLLQPLGCLKQVVADTKTNEIWYRFEGVNKWIPSKDLIFPWWFSKDGILPVSPISAIANELSIQYGAETVISNFYKNGTFQVLYVEANMDLGLSDKNKAKEYWSSFETEIAGSQNAFNGGVLKVPPMFTLKSIPLPDLKFLEASKWTESRIASIYHIPGYLLNLNEGSSSNPKVEQQSIAFKNNTLSNVTNILLNELNAKLLTVEEREAGVYIDFDYSQLFSVDLESKAIYMDKLFKMGSLSVNEVRQAFGYDKVDNEYCDWHYIQSQYQAIEKYDLWINNKISLPAPTQKEEEE